MTIDELQECIRIASRDMRYLPRAAPAKHKSFWPHYELDYQEPEDRKVYDIGNIDRVIDWIADGPLSVFERKLIWERTRHGKYQAWRKVAFRLGKSHEWCRKCYDEALEKLHKSLVNKGFVDNG